jgi:hypothetical protein
VTGVPLYPAQSETVTLPNVPASASKTGTFYAVVDPPDAPAHPSWHECRTDNNDSLVVSVDKVCGGGPK